jgi:8-oxo-dGTP pyrophosphatase MutT (NUDIX family)
MLFIERARHDDDPWSGNLGFPGGKVEKHDAGERQAAERETREEIGLDLASARCLGRLSDIAGAHLPVRVSCYVYGLPDAPTVLILGEEVRTVYWVPFTDLLAPERHISAPVRFSGTMLTSPAIRLLKPESTPLWGITYRLVMQFLQLLDVLPLSAPSSPAVPSGVRKK